MPELRGQTVIRASAADYRPVTAGNGDDPAAKRAGDAQTRGAVLRARRNGLPVTRPYRYGESSYPWAVRALQAAEKVYGAPEAEREDDPRRAQKPGGDR